MILSFVVKVGLQNLMSFDGRASAMMNMSGSFAVRGSNLGSFGYNASFAADRRGSNLGSFACVALCMLGDLGRNGKIDLDFCGRLI